MWRFFLVILGCLYISGCAQKGTFVLLPDPDGKVGEIVVTNARGSQTLNQARQAVHIAGETVRPGDATTMDESQIRSMFGKAIDIQPMPPAKFLLYFEFESVRPTSESATQIPAILQAADQRISKDISVNGHTDRTGPIDYNDQLAFRRAYQVKNMLEQGGIDPAVISVTSHGMHNPLIPTAEKVSEPRNRRVEVIVR